MAMNAAARRSNRFMSRDFVDGKGNSAGGSRQGCFHGFSGMRHMRDAELSDGPPPALQMLLVRLAIPNPFYDPFQLQNWAKMHKMGEDLSEGFGDFSRGNLALPFASISRRGR